MRKRKEFSEFKILMVVDRCFCSANAVISYSSSTKVVMVTSFVSSEAEPPPSKLSSLFPPWTLLAIVALISFNLSIVCAES